MLLQWEALLSKYVDTCSKLLIYCQSRLLSVDKFLHILKYVRISSTALLQQDICPRQPSKQTTASPRFVNKYSVQAIPAKTLGNQDFANKSSSFHIEQIFL